MKRCPSCERTYTDDALSFCPNDGTPLVTGDAPSSPFDPQATIMASPPKVSAPSGPFDQPSGPTDWPSQPPPASDWPSQPPPAPARSDWGTPSGGYQPVSQPMAGYQAPPPPPFPGVQQKQQGFAIASMVCGILSVVCCLGIFSGVPAVILGIMAMNKEKADPVNFGGRGMALAGVITGGLGSLLGLIWLVMQIIGLLLRH